MSEALAPLFTTVAEFVTIVANWASQNPVLAGTIVAIVVGIGILLGIVTALIPLIFGLTGGVITLTSVMAVLTSPITLVILAITALIAIGILLWKNWGTIQAKGARIK